MDRRTNLGVLLLAGALAAPLPAAAVDDMFLRLDGVKGETLDPRHPGEIEILSYTQSFTARAPARGTTSAAGPGTTMCVAVTVMKYVDVSSPDLILSAMNGRHFRSAVITFRKPGQQPIEYYKVMLDDVMVAEVEQSNSRLNFPNPAPPRAIEKLSLIAQRFRIEYLGQSADGAGGARPKAGWDCAQNKKL